jgi:hypothetical protein
MWKAHPEDLSQGLHPFCVGKTSPDEILALQELARKYNLIVLDGASPSLWMRASWTRQSLHSAQSHRVGRANQLFHNMLLRVFLGNIHLVTQGWEAHTIATQQQLLNLQFYSPRMPRHQLLLPALIQRWYQLCFGCWLELQ